MKKLLIAMLSTAILVSMTGCGDKNKENTSTSKQVEAADKKSEKTTVYPIKIKNFGSDNKEYEQAFNKQPEKVVSVHGITTQMLYDLGLEDKLIAAVLPDGKPTPQMEEKYKKLKTTFKGLPSEESITGLEPDFILGLHPSFMGGRPTTKAWNDKGINTYKVSSTLDVRTVEHHLKNISDIGKILGEEKKVNEYVAKQEKTISEVKDAVNKIEQKPKVILLHKIKDKYAVFGTNTLAGNIAEASGLSLIPNTPAGSFGLETLIGMNPDVIIYSSYVGTDEDKSNDEKLAALKNETSLQSINAIKNNKLTYVDFSVMSGTGADPAKTIETYVKYVYPQIDWSSIFSTK